MTTFAGFTAAVAVGGALLLGGIGATSAQQGTQPQIDVDQLVAELGLPADVKDELNELNQLLARRALVREQAVEIHSGMSDIWSNVLAQLTPEQRRGLHRAMRDYWATRGMGRHMVGGMQGQGHISGCGDGVGGMGSMGWMGHGSGMGSGAGMRHRPWN